MKKLEKQNQIQLIEPKQKDLTNILEFVLSEAKKKGVDQAEIAATHSTGLNVTARLGDTEVLEYANDRGVGITIYNGMRKGNASTSDFSISALQETLEKACVFAKHTAADKFSGLADPDNLASSPFPNLDCKHKWDLSVDEAINMAINCEEIALTFDPRISNSEGASVATRVTAKAYGNTHGFLDCYTTTNHSISCVVVGHSSDEMQRDYWYSSARDSKDLDSLRQIGKKAAKRTLNRLGAKKIKTTNAPVVFSPELARGFLGHAIAAITGSAQYRKSSFLLDAVGKQIFPEFLQIQERPHIKKGMASKVYDAEGVATNDRELVVDGILQEYVLSSYSARRLGLKTTGNAGGTHNLVVPGNTSGKKEIIKTLSRGFLVQELIGQGVNGVTGDYSRGAVGYWIEDGQVSYPVHEVTIAGNLLDLYKRISMVGNDQDVRGGFRCGSLLVDDMKIAGT